MPGSKEPTNRELSLPWIEIIGKNLASVLALLHVK